MPGARLRPPAPETPKVRLRPLAREEWTVLRALRLRALGDAPDSFGPTYADASREPDEWWQRGARYFATDRARLIVVELDDGFGGLVSAVADEAGIGHVGAMWLEPGLRGGGLGRKLLRAATDFLESIGCAVITLQVTETNTPAIRLYETEGFRQTGRTEPLRQNSPLQNLEMTR